MEGFPLDGINEIKYLKSLNHPNILRFLDVVVGKYNLSKDSILNPEEKYRLEHSYLWDFYIVFEYSEHTLSCLLERGCIFSSSQIKCILKQILEGLNYMHEHNVMHRDIKTSNILVNSSGIVKLGDFGLSTKFKPNIMMKEQNNVATLWYRAPEILCNQEYTNAIDIWGVGCVMGKLITSKAIFIGKDNNHQFNVILTKLCGKKPILWEMLKSM